MSNIFGSVRTTKVQIMEDTTMLTDTDAPMDDDRVPDSKKGEGGSNRQSLKSRPRIRIRFPTSPKHKEEESMDAQSPNAERVAEDAEPVETDDNGSDRNDEKIDWHTCEICVGRRFPSIKGLFGHMRLHNSRKTKKEAKKKENSNSITDEVHPLDLDLCNTKWLNADKRGRKRKDVTGPQIDENVVNAAIILMSFTEPSEYSKRRCLGIESTDGKLVALVSSSENQGTEKLEISGWGATMHVIGAATLPAACSDLLPNVIEAEDTHNGGILGIVGTTNHEHADSTKDSTKLDTGDNAHGDTETKENCTMVSAADNEDCGNAASSRSKTTGSHVCRICGKSYKTHQALGGHMASHTKGNLQSLTGEGGGVPMLEEIEGKKNDRVAKVKGQEHKCRICGKEFPLGQSLGGHMRRHYTPPEKNNTGDGSSAEDDTEKTAYDDLAEQTCSEPRTSDGSSGSLSSGNCPRDFDLNELPKQGEGGI